MVAIGPRPSSWALGRETLTAAIKKLLPHRGGLPSSANIAAAAAFIRTIIQKYVMEVLFFILFFNFFLLRSSWMPVSFMRVNPILKWYVWTYVFRDI